MLRYALTILVLKPHQAILQPPANTSKRMPAAKSAQRINVASISIASDFLERKRRTQFAPWNTMKARWRYRGAIIIPRRSQEYWSPNSLNAGKRVSTGRVSVLASLHLNSDEGASPLGSKTYPIAFNRLVVAARSDIVGSGPSALSWHTGSGTRHLINVKIVLV